MFSVFLAKKVVDFVKRIQEAECSIFTTKDTNTWQELKLKEGLIGLYIICETYC